MKKSISIYLFLLFLTISSHSYAFQIISMIDDYVIEVYEPSDVIPVAVLDEGRNMYYEAYMFPKLHEGIPLKELKIDEAKFSSYEEFIEDMFATDFASYQYANDRYYFQVRHPHDGRIVGIGVLLIQELPGHYYIDHIGTHKDFRRLGFGTQLLWAMKQVLPDFEQISLDTRVFNAIAQSFYEKAGFFKQEIHPNPKKQTTYCHYILLNK